MILRLRRMLGLFAADTRGIGAVEFAMLLPVMLTLYLGVVELANGIIADRKTTNVARTAADLAAQSIALSNSDMTDIFDASTAILAPYDPATVQITLTSVVEDEDGNTEVAWSAARNATARTTGSGVTIPDGLLLPSGSVILAEVSYTYTSPIGDFFTSGVTFTDKFYMRPRRSLRVNRTS